MAADVAALLDHLRLDRVELVACSIDTAVALHLLQNFPARVGRVVLLDTGDGLVGFPPLTAADAQSVKHPMLVVSGDRDRVLGRGPPVRFWPMSLATPSISKLPEPITSRSRPTQR